HGNAISLVHDPAMTRLGQNRLRTATASGHALHESSERVMATIVIVGEEIIDHRLAALLEGHGHRVLEAANSEQALEIVRAEKPDLVLADILIGNLDGGQFAQSLGAQAGRPRLIFLTAAYMEAEARALARACGVAELIVKPDEPEALLASISAALSGSAPQTAKPSLEPGSAEPSLRPIVGKLYERVAELERLGAQLDQRAAERAEQLEVARAALEQEVTK